MMWMHMFLTRPERTSLSWKRRSERRIVFVCRAAGMWDAWGGAMVRAPRARSREGDAPAIATRARRCGPSKIGGEKGPSRPCI